MKLAAPNRVFFAASALLGLAIAPAWLAAHGYFVATAAIFAFFSKVCHQRPDRSFILLGAPVAVCVRCVGIYAGAAFGSLLQVHYRTAIRALGAALALNCADVAAGLLHLHGNMPLSRLLIGATLGIAAGMMLSTEHCRRDIERADLLTR